MPAPRVFLTSKDIATVTGMSIRSAQNMLYMFAHQGQVVRRGDSNRGCMVDINIFVRYLCKQDGADPVERKNDIMNCLREADSVHTRKDAR